MSGLRHRARRSSRLGISPTAVVAALAGLVTVLVLVGCGNGSSSTTQNTGDQLAIYSSLPLQGPTATSALAIANGEKLALAQAGGRVGQFSISYQLLNDSSPKNGIWNAGITASNAKAAGDDTTTIAYIGDYDSGATAVSLPIMNSLGILQISPGSPYVGLTSSLDAGQDEPDRFYPTGKRNFGRLVPGDAIQGAADAAFMHSLGIHRVYVINDEDPFESALASIVSGDASRRGIKVLAHDLVDTTASTYKGEVRKVVKSRAQAVFFSGGANAGALALWRERHAADPRLILLGCNAVDNSSFTSRLGSAARKSYISTPILPAGLYPPSAQAFFRQYRRYFKSVASPSALYGYEAMEIVLLSIRRAGAHGNDRASVVKQFFAIHDRNSVLGSYSVLKDGDTTLSYYAIDRVVNGNAVFGREIKVPPV